MAREDLEQTELARLQVELAATEADGAMHRVDDEVADDDRLRRNRQGADFRREANAVARTLKHEGRLPDAVEPQRIITAVRNVSDRADFIVAQRSRGEPAALPRLSFIDCEFLECRNHRHVSKTVEKRRARRYGELS